MRPSVTLCLLIGLAACEEESLCERAAAVDDAGLVLGTGAEAFEAPIEDGDTLQMTFGSQGGTHLYLAVRTRGFGPGGRRALGQDSDVPVFTIALDDADTGERLTEQLFSYEAMRGDEVEAELALGEFFLPFGGYDTTEAPPPSAYRLTVTGEDECGTVLVDEQLVSIE